MIQPREAFVLSIDCKSDEHIKTPDDVQEMINKVNDLLQENGYKIMWRNTEISAQQFYHFRHKCFQEQGLVDEKGQWIGDD